MKNYDMQNPLKLTSNVVLTSRIWYINDIAMPWIALTQLFTIIQPKKINLVTTSLKRPVNDVTMTHVHACYLNWSYYPHVANPFERWFRSTGEKAARRTLIKLTHTWSFCKWRIGGLSDIVRRRPTICDLSKELGNNFLSFSDEEENLLSFAISLARPGHYGLLKTLIYWQILSWTPGVSNHFQLSYPKT